MTDDIFGRLSRRSFTGALSRVEMTARVAQRLSFHVFGRTEPMLSLGIRHARRARAPGVKAASSYSWIEELVNRLDHH